MSSTQKLVADIEALLAAAKSTKLDRLDYGARLELIGKVEDIHYQMDDPVLAMYRQLTNFTRTAAMRTVLRLGVLNAIPRDGFVSSKVLASTIKQDEEFLIQMMRPLTATGILKEKSENVYAHTRFSMAYINGSEVDFYKLCIDEVAPNAFRIPSSGSSHKSSTSPDPKRGRAPTSCTSAGSSAACSTAPSSAGSPCPTPRRSPSSTSQSSMSSMTTMSSLEDAKEQSKRFFERPEPLARHKISSTSQEVQRGILGAFPIASLAKKMHRRGYSDEKVFIVDVAGGRGQSLVAIRNDLEAEGGRRAGRWILQEKKGILESIADDDLQGIERMTADFFKPQPVKGAHIYHLRRVLHNWQDAECKQILKNIAAAMAQDSTLMIGEVVIPEVSGVNNYMYALDICMQGLGGKERTERNFSNLLNASGLKLVKVWHSNTGNQTVIEARLK